MLQCIDWLRLLRVTHWIKSTQTVFSGSYRDIVRNQCLSRLCNGGYALNGVISWHKIRIDGNFHLFGNSHLIPGQQYQPCPHGNCNHSKSSSKDKEASFHSRSLVPPGHLEWAEIIQTESFQLEKSITCQLHYAPESETMEQKVKETSITLSRDPWSTMLAQKGPRHIRLAREIIF